MSDVFSGNAVIKDDFVFVPAHGGEKTANHILSSLLVQGARGTRAGFVAYVKGLSDQHYGNRGINRVMVEIPAQTVADYMMHAFPHAQDPLGETLGACLPWGYNDGVGVNFNWVKYDGVRTPDITTEEYSTGDNTFMYMDFRFAGNEADFDMAVFTDNHCATIAVKVVQDKIPEIVKYGRDIDLRVPLTKVKEITESVQRILYAHNKFYCMVLPSAPTLSYRVEHFQSGRKEPLGWPILRICLSGARDMGHSELGL